MKTVKSWRKTLKKTLEDGVASHVHESAELNVIWKWPSYQNQYTDSM
jgi:hypothetical protein